MIHIDKITHTLAGAAIAAALLPWGVILALAAVLVAALGKELWDAQGHGTPDHIDALAMVARELAAMLPPMPVDQQYIDDRARDSARALEMAALAFVPAKNAEKLCPLKCS